MRVIWGKDRMFARAILLIVMMVPAAGEAQTAERLSFWRRRSCLAR